MSTHDLGVAAAFECKTTLKSHHVTQAVKTAAEIRKNLAKQTGSPYRELNSPIIYGLLAHSHVWKGANSKPKENIDRALNEADLEHSTHPIQMIDFITVSDLATWHPLKWAHCGPPVGAATTGYICAAIGSANQHRALHLLGPFCLGCF